MSSNSDTDKGRRSQNLSRKRQGKYRSKYDDKQLKIQLQEALSEDKHLRSYVLKVDVVKGEAQLHGIVDTLSEKERAEKVARSIPGIQKVANAISISTDGPVTDSEVEFEVAEELNADPDVNTKHIGARSSHGVVTLVGKANHPEEIKAARKAATKARGVAKVVSRVRVDDQYEPSGEEIFHSQVRNDEEKDKKKKR